VIVRCMTLQMPMGAAPWREPRSARDPLSDAAIEAAATALPGDCLRDLWQDVLDSRVVYYREGTGPSGRYVLCRVGERLPTLEPLSLNETAVLVRVLDGEQQKAIAAELGIACSTASKGYTQAAKKLHLNAGPIPLPLIIAAQSWASRTTPPVDARRATIVHQGDEFVLVTVPAPNLASETRLTRAERDVAQALVEGQSRWEIAARRSTSTQTVACQFRGIFAKLQVGGRCSLIKRGLAAGWFR
jgi:DNA-binding NarL/FixJ family response regulator